MGGCGRHCLPTGLTGVCVCGRHCLPTGLTGVCVWQTLSAYWADWCVCVVDIVCLLC